MHTPDPRNHRVDLIDEADIHMLVARRRTRQVRDYGASMALTGDIDTSLRRACRLYTLAGLTHRADVLARFGWRLVKLRRIRLPHTKPTLSEPMLEKRFGPKKQKGGHHG